MRAYRTEFNAGFSKGLRVEASGPRNSGLFTECINGRLKNGILEGYTPDITAFPAITGVTTTFDWPFPQLMWADDKMYVGNATSLYQCSPTAGVWAGTNLATAFTHGITWPWTFAKFTGFPVFACGDLLVYYDYDATAWKFWQKGDAHSSNGSRWHADWYQPISIGNFRGQAVTGGCKDTSAQCRLIRWSDIGSFAFLGKTAVVRKNEAGEWFMPYDDKEIVMRVLPLESAMIIYGTFGVWAMIPVSRPAATFGFKCLWEPGIANPLAAGGDLKKHLFVDRLGNLVQIEDKNLTATKLGYSEFLLPLQSSVSISTSTGLIRVMYNESEDEFYIGSEAEQYCYREGGLTEITRAITSMVNLEKAQITDAATRSTITGNPYGFFSDIAPTETYLRFVTDTIDMGLNAIKTIETVEIMGDMPSYTSMDVSIYYRYDKSGSFSQSSWIRCNPAGVGVPIVSGVDLRVAVRITPITSVKISGITVSWKLSDKRHIRGLYARPANAGSGLE